MTLIPLISAMLTAPRSAAAPVGATTMPFRNSYGSDAGRHPVAALLAVGLPTMLVAAAALSPMVVEMVPKTDPIRGKLIELQKPIDPPPPKALDKAEPTPRTASATDTVKPVIETPSFTENVVVEGLVIPDVGPVDPGPPAKPIDPPAPAKLAFAELDPRFAGVFQPEYPASEQRREIEGIARVRVLIGTDGRVKAVELVSTDSPGFFEETKRRALAKWRFKPATRGGIAEESWKVMTVRFEIKNA